MFYVKNMATAQWHNLSDEITNFNFSVDSDLSSAEPYEHADEVDGYHEKHVRESKGKLFVKGKNGKIRRTAAGEGLYRNQISLKSKLENFKLSRLMKRTAPTKALLDSRSSRGERINSKLNRAERRAIGVADAPIPQNINAVRRKIKSGQFPGTGSSTQNSLSLPANIGVYLDAGPTHAEKGKESTSDAILSDSTLFTLQDGTEPGKGIHNADENDREQTVMFATHGVINLACDPIEMEHFRIGDVVFLQKNPGLKHMNGDHTQYNVSSVSDGESKMIGFYLGPCSTNKRGGIVVRLSPP